MLVHSNKPEILRLHEIEQRQRGKFITSFTTALAELLPSSANRTIRSSLLLTRILKAFPDLYFTLVNVYISKRRLGEEYTYIAMYKQQHYLEQGKLLNKKTRLLLFVLEMISRNLLSPLFTQYMQPKGAVFDQKASQSDKSGRVKLMEKVRQVIEMVREGAGRYLGSAQEIMSNVEWLILMVYMLDWNKHFTFIETLLGIRYVYTYKNDQIRDVSYAIEGYLLLATFLFKAGKNLYSLFKARQARSKEPEPPPSQIKPGSGSSSMKKEKNLCRICYDDVKCRSATKCGHIFCWDCIIKTLEMSEECPVCRTNCRPREVVQLRNI